jgi:hypothetical protein
MIVDRRRLRGPLLMTASLALVNLGLVFSRPSIASIRAVDIVQLMGAGTIFGVTLVVFFLYLRAPRPQ